jgi:hypothetical protein
MSQKITIQMWMNLLQMKILNKTNLDLEEKFIVLLQKVGNSYGFATLNLYSFHTST